MKKVFISYSGIASSTVASQLTELIKLLPFQNIDPWMAEGDIRSGKRWNRVLADRLNSSEFGILCITKSNKVTPWIMFEAGALSKNVDSSRVIPYLIDLSPSELSAPLNQFQAISATRSGTKALMEQLFKVDRGARTLRHLQQGFDSFWPRLEEQIEAAKTSEEHIIEEPISEDRPNLDFFVLRANNMLDSLNRKVNALSIDKGNSTIAEIQTQLDRLEVLGQITEGNTYMNDDAARALGIFETALKKDPNNDDLLIHIAKARYRIKDVDGAIDVLNRVLRKNKSNARAYYNRACYLANSPTRNRFNKVIENLKSAVKLEPYYAQYALKDKDFEIIRSSKNKNHLEKFLAVCKPASLTNSIFESQISN